MADTFVRHSKPQYSTDEPQYSTDAVKYSCVRYSP